MRIQGLFISVLLAATNACNGTALGSQRAATQPGRGFGIAEREWQDDRGQPVRFSSWRGTPLIVTMVYSSCLLRCPMTLVKLRHIESSFAKRGLSVSFALVTLDPEHDTPLRLTHYMTDRHLARASWHLLRGDPSETKELSKFLHLHSFKDDSHIDHDVEIAVFDSKGRFARSFRGWNFADEEVLKAVE